MMKASVMATGLVLAAAVTTAGLVTGGTAVADVRHSEVPESLRGTWIPATGSCPAPAGSGFVLTARSYAKGGETCSVEWVEERAATPGTMYSVHMRCGTTAASETNVMVWLKGPDTAATGTDFRDLADARICR